MRNGCTGGSGLQERDAAYAAPVITRGYRLHGVRSFPVRRAESHAWSDSQSLRATGGACAVAASNHASTEDIRHCHWRFPGSVGWVFVCGLNAFVDAAAVALGLETMAIKTERHGA
jgi:hypothetical protein